MKLTANYIRITAITGKFRVAALFTILLFSAACVALYTPELEETGEFLVVQGMIDDSDERDTIKLSKSFPLGNVKDSSPVTGLDVSFSDDLGNVTWLQEITPGIYVTPDGFRGVAGRSYTLHVAGAEDRSYVSDPAEMVPVPPIDSLYYEKIVIDEPSGYYKGIEAGQIYLDTRDPSDVCRWFRWSFVETWIFRLNFSIENKLCWIYDWSKDLDLKSTVSLSGSEIKRHPVTYISHLTDRLMVRYSILVNQYSLNEDEYLYWEKVKDVIKNTGGLYDMIPASLPNNLHCIEDPDETVLGYFSVSAKASKRIFIQEEFAGIIDRYANCVSIVTHDSNIIGLNVLYWLLLTEPCSLPCSPTYYYTNRKDCTDCTLRGTNKRPAFWTDK